jgi:hypothetical protein
MVSAVVKPVSSATVNAVVSGTVKQPLVSATVKPVVSAMVNQVVSAMVKPAVNAMVKQPMVNPMVKASPLCVRVRRRVVSQRSLSAAQWSVVMVTAATRQDWMAVRRPARTALMTAVTPCALRLAVPQMVNAILAFTRCHRATIGTTSKGHHRDTCALWVQQ